MSFDKDDQLERDRFHQEVAAVHLRVRRGDKVSCFATVPYRHDFADTPRGRVCLECGTSAEIAPKRPRGSRPHTDTASPAPAPPKPPSKVARGEAHLPPCPTRANRGHLFIADVIDLKRWCAVCPFVTSLPTAGIARARRVRRLAERDGWFCFYCRVPLDPHGRNHSRHGPNQELDALTPWTPTIEHRFPRAKGGSWSDSNLVLACQWCNSLKGSEPEIVFLGLAAFRERRAAVAERYGLPSPKSPNTR